MARIEGDTALARVPTARSSAAAPASLAPRAVALLREHGAAAAGYGLPFALVSYLALKGGGYDAIVRGEIGIAAWWLVLLGAAVGALPAARVTRAGWVALGLLAGLAAWTALGVSWSESSERSVLEATRVAALLGVLALAILAQGREGLRRTVGGVGAAIALVAALALLSRLQPGWLPATSLAAELEGARYRLSYPLDYWNGLAALLAVGLPLLVWIATQARHLASRALAAAAIPALILAGYYTFSRGGALEAAVGLGALCALHPRRLALLPTVVLAATGGTLLIAAAGQRDALADGLTTPLALAQGDEMLVMTLIVCAGVALIQVATGIAARRRLGPRLVVSPGTARRAAAGGALAAVIASIAIGLPGLATDGWEEFTAGQSPGQGAERFASAAGNSRFQYWTAALDAGSAEPLTGIGAGAFELWWAREREVAGFVRDAHSLFLEVLGELGVPGLLAVLGLVAVVLGAGAARALRGADLGRRSLLAASTAAAAAFTAAAAIDWVWELTVLPVAFALLAAAILGPSAESRWRRTSRFERRPLPRAGRAAIAVVAAAAIVGIAIPMAATSLIRDSREAVATGDLDAALVDARRAAEAQPYAAAPRLQETLVLELRGDLPAALSSARAATAAEPADWRNWLIRSRIAARLGSAEDAVRSYRRARALNPRSRLLRGGPG